MLRCDKTMACIVVAGSLCGAILNLSDLLGLKDTVLYPHFSEPTIVIIERQLRVCFTVRWSLVMRGQCLLL